MISKKIIAIDLVFIVGGLLIVGSLVGYSRPLVIAPLDGLETSGSVLFKFEKADKILIDDNLEFSSPEEYNVQNNLVINLKPGKYYWKITGVLESEIREFTIKSEVDLRVNENEGGYEVVNSGNERLNVEVYEHGVLSGNVVLDVDDGEGIEGDKFVGVKDDE